MNNTIKSNLYINNRIPYEISNLIYKFLIDKICKDNIKYYDVEISKLKLLINVNEFYDDWIKDLYSLASNLYKRSKCELREYHNLNNDYIKKHRILMPRLFRKIS